MSFLQHLYMQFRQNVRSTTWFSTISRSTTLHSTIRNYLHTRQLTLVVRLQGVHFMNWTIWIKKNFGQFLLSNFGQIYIPTYIQVCAIDNCTYNFSDYSGHKYFFRYYKPLSGHPCKLQLVNYCPKLIHKIDPRPDPLPRCGWRRRHGAGLRHRQHHRQRVLSG
jgi:hypothetical protein